MINLLIMGKPGAGKGTQATLLLDYYKMTHISTGDIYREEMAKNSEIGQLAKHYISQGELVPDDVTNDIVKQVLHEKNYPHGFMLDGYPRTKAQAIALDSMLEELGIHLTKVINVDVDDKVLLERMAGRRVCSKCGATYHIHFHPPVKDCICDVCGSKLVQREDDLEESVLNRLRIYNDKTKPLLDYYKRKGLLMVVNGEQPKDVVFRKIVSQLGDES